MLIFSFILSLLLNYILGSLFLLFIILYSFLNVLCDIDTIDSAVFRVSFDRFILAFAMMLTHTIIHYYLNTLLWISSITIYNLCYLSSYSSFLNIGLSRLGNIMFDSSLFSLVCSIFIINIFIIIGIFTTGFLYYLAKTITCHLPNEHC